MISIVSSLFSASFQFSNILQTETLFQHIITVYCISSNVSSPFFNADIFFYFNYQIFSVCFFLFLLSEISSKAQKIYKEFK